MLITRVYDRDMILKQWELQDFLVELIQKNNYIYFLRNIPGGGKHEVFISGFDSDRKEFLCHDFGMDSTVRNGFPMMRSLLFKIRISMLNGLRIT